jgi:type III secretory pathway component EscU
MTHENRQRIERPATPEEKARHQQIRQEIEEELPELKHWARSVAADHTDRIAVGTVFAADEAPVVKAIDEYAAKHSLQNRSAVVREALAQLLAIEVARQ